MFWQAEGETGYREFNFSPSGQWAAYAFDDIRSGMRDARVRAISLSCSSDPSELIVTANLSAGLADPAKIGLSAVIEDLSGNKSYWALHHAKAQPDFHDPSCFTARLA